MAGRKLGGSYYRGMLKLAHLILSSPILSGVTLALPAQSPLIGVDLGARRLVRSTGDGFGPALVQGDFILYEPVAIDLSRDERLIQAVRRDASTGRYHLAQIEPETGQVTLQSQQLLQPSQGEVTDISVAPVEHVT